MTPNTRVSPRAVLAYSPPRKNPLTIEFNNIRLLLLVLPEPWHWRFNRSIRSRDLRINLHILPVLPLFLDRRSDGCMVRSELNLASGIQASYLRDGGINRIGVQ